MDILTRLTLVALLAPCRAGAAESAQDGSWTLAREANGIMVHTRKVEGSKFLEFKGTASIDATIEDILARHRDVDSMPHWLYNCIDAVLVTRESDDEFVTLTRIRTHWLVSRRDSVVRSTIVRDPVGGDVTIYLAGEPDSVPKQRNHVRVRQLIGTWRLVPQENGYLFTADAGVGAGQKRPPRLSYSACSGPGGSRFANWANGLNGLRASWVD